MFFKNKSNDKEVKCLSCNKNANEKYSFCPYCGNSLVDKMKEAQKYGFIGKEDSPKNINPLANAGIMEKIFSSIMQNAIRSMTQEMQNTSQSKVQNIPNGIRITLGAPTKRMPQNKPKQAPVQEITDEQIERMSKLPRTKAKTNIKRFHDKVLYELSAPGITSPEDIFISKLENGYEVKAIGKSNIYVNSLPIDLPLKKYSVSESGIIFEFSANPEQ